ncbi:unnamed protein product, partial [Mesorhabditis spiculigera]
MPPRVGGEQITEPEILHVAPPPPNVDELIGLARARLNIPEFVAAEQLLGANRPPGNRLEEAQIIVASFIVIQTRYLLLRGAIHRADPRILMIGEDGLVAYLREYSALYDRAKARMMHLIARPGEHRHHRGFLRLQRAALAWMRQVRILEQELGGMVAALFN